MLSDVTGVHILHHLNNIWIISESSWCPQAVPLHVAVSWCNAETWQTRCSAWLFFLLFELRTAMVGAACADIFSWRSLSLALKSQSHGSHMKSPGCAQPFTIFHHLSPFHSGILLRSPGRNWPMSWTFWESWRLELELARAMAAVAAMNLHQSSAIWSCWSWCHVLCLCRVLSLWTCQCDLYCAARKEALERPCHGEMVSMTPKWPQKGWINRHL